MSESMFDLAVVYVFAFCFWPDASFFDMALWTPIIIHSRATDEVVDVGIIAPTFLRPVE